MRFVLLFFLFSLAKSLSGCVCQQKEPLSVQVCGLYDVIFFGSIKEIKTCEKGNSIATFTVSELFKGNVSESCEVHYLCGSVDCSVDFQLGSEWLIFADKNNAQECVFDLCSYSRQLLSENVADYENQLRGSTFFEDKKFINTHFELKAKLGNELQARRYEKVSPSMIPVLLVVSLVFMAVAWLVFNSFGRVSAGSRTSGADSGVKSNKNKNKNKNNKG